jgi:hypothetical protein
MEHTNSENKDVSLLIADPGNTDFSAAEKNVKLHVAKLVWFQVNRVNTVPCHTFLTSETGAADVQVGVQPYPEVWQPLTEAEANVDVHVHEVHCYYSQPRMNQVLTADGCEN